MPPAAKPFLAVALVALVGWVSSLLLSRSEPPVETVPQQSRVPEMREAAAPQREQTLGDQVLANYGNPNSELHDDLSLFKNYLGNVLLLVKQRDPRHYATNEDLALFLLGQKGNRTPFLSDCSAVLNGEQQLVDRFGSPLIVHPFSRDQVEIRSAGPDLIPYTADDVVK